MIHLRPWYPRFMSMDFGFVHHTAVFWFASDGDKTYCYREMVVNHQTAPELAAEIVARTPTSSTRGGFDERAMVKTFYAGPDIFSRKTSDRTTAIELDSALAPHGFGFNGVSPAAAGPGDRRLGWQLVYQLLKQGRLKISPACVELVKAIPEAVRDFPKNPDDLVKTDTIGDDCLDSFRYGVYTSSLQPRIPIEIAAARLVTAPVENLLARSVQYRDAYADLKRRRAGISFGR